MGTEHKGSRGPEMVNADRSKGLNIFSEFAGVSYRIIGNDVVFRYNGQQIRMNMSGNTLDIIDELKDVVEMWRK